MRAAIIHGSGNVSGHRQAANHRGHRSCFAAAKEDLIFGDLPGNLHEGDIQTQSSFVSEWCRNSVFANINGITFQFYTKSRTNNTHSIRVQSLESSSRANQIRNVKRHDTEDDEAQDCGSSQIETSFSEGISHVSFSDLLFFGQRVKNDSGFNLRTQSLSTETDSTSLLTLIRSFVIEMRDWRWNPHVLFWLKVSV